jgi:hypothetical protein
MALRSAVQRPAVGAAPKVRGRRRSIVWQLGFPSRAVASAAVDRRPRQAPACVPAAYEQPRGDNGAPAIGCGAAKRMRVRLRRGHPQPCLTLMHPHPLRRAAVPA